MKKELQNSSRQLFGFFTDLYHSAQILYSQGACEFVPNGKDRQNCLKIGFSGILQKILFIFIILTTSLAANPWGKDADLAKPKSEITIKKQTPLVKLAEVMIKFHQNNISKTDGPRSHYTPSSSQYTLDAIQKYGFFYGYLLGCDRLMRENNDPWIYPTINGKYNKLKHDPVR